MASFGPTALATPANAVTVARALLTPVLLVLVINSGDSWPTLLLWVVLATSDGLDGYMARRQGTTRSGAFLDPLADKFCVLGAMVALVIIERFWWVPVAVIAAREVTISLYRTWVGHQGISVPARQWAKVKTVTQDLAVGFALLPLTADTRPGLADVAVWIAVVLTVLTGVQYLIEGRRAATTTTADTEAGIGT
jgi:CDP-diacylglycerol--glycerol-3-phosphate 3-phosphatidyltransferase